MSHIADEIKKSQDTVAMLRRALERIIQLYTDKSHFIYELIQNAEDAEATSIKFVQYSDRLEVFHDGKPFTKANLQSLCDIGSSDKIKNLNQIGEFGVGFKSVFGICDSVRLYSVAENFRKSPEDDARTFAIEILNFTEPRAIPEEHIPKPYTTRFVLPYAAGLTFSGYATEEDLKYAISTKLQNLGITTLLFMKNLTSIEYQILIGEEPVKGEYLLEKQDINDHCQLVSALGTAEKEKSNAESEQQISYLKFSRLVSMYAPRTVDIAFPIRIEEDGSYTCIKNPTPFVSVYFPTETESKLDFIVQGPYRTTPNRSSIPADDRDNKYLAEETSTLLFNSIWELRQADKLNMSFLKILPITKSKFATFKLFLPLYDVVKILFLTSDVIPSKSGMYVTMQQAKITRQERLSNVLTDDKLSQLINDGSSYYWLPTYLTETNREYRHVLDYLNGDLGITVIHPEDLHRYISKNPEFLPAQSDDWLIKLYKIYENIPSAFSRSKNDASMATAAIIKTSKGDFVAPYRKEGKNYTLNIFLPSPNVYSTEINFVELSVYNKCRRFFDDIINIQKPNEYEILIKNIEKRYSDIQNLSDLQHIYDLKAILKYIDFDEYESDVKRIIRNVILLRCTDGKMRRPGNSRIFLPETSEGINIEAYYRNIRQDAFFVDVNYYVQFNIRKEHLINLGVRCSLIVDDDVTSGTLETTLKNGRTIGWRTSGLFRLKLSVDCLFEVLKYISSHPKAEDSKLKSQAIMKILMANENRLCGNVHFDSPQMENRYDDPCEMIRILRGDLTSRYSWDGKWLYTESGELVLPRCISKYELSVPLYGKIKPDSVIFKLFKFKIKALDEIEEFKKNATKEMLDSFFESELKERYGITTSDLNDRYGNNDQPQDTAENKPTFPSLNVRSWKALKKHVVEMLSYANPIKYEERIRSVRSSYHANEARAYLENMYSYEGHYRDYQACQLCHNMRSDFVATEIFLNMDKELEQLNLCLCPNCAAVYRKIRTNKYYMDTIRKAFFTKTESVIETEDHVSIPITKKDELWFTQTHFAEIRELLSLLSSN